MIVNMYSMNINCANMQSCKLGDDEFDEHDIFSPPTNEEVIKGNAIHAHWMKNMIEE